MSSATEYVLASRRFIQVPGPNPIVSRGEAGEWDESCIEAADIIKDYDTYYLYYHGWAEDEQKWPRPAYRLGVATAKHPLGPWTKHPGNPIMTKFGYVGGVIRHAGKYWLYPEHPTS